MIMSLLHIHPPRLVLSPIAILGEVQRKDRISKMWILRDAVAILGLGSIGLSAQSAAPATAAVSRVHQLEIEDQSENPGNVSAAEYYRHGDARRAEVRKLLGEGKITSSEDLSDAALIFQHGQTPEEFLFAHVLAVEALLRGDSADKWLAAATLDRYLQAMNRPQVFGTQYPGTRLRETRLSRRSTRMP